MNKIITCNKKLPKLEIKDTKKYGQGVFAGEDIKEGQKVHVLNGTKFDVMGMVEKINSDKINIDDLFQIGKRTYMELDSFSRFFNHNCNPNVGVRKTNEMFALRDIKKNEEITFDYSLTVAPTVWKMKCKCGSKNCRKILGDISTIPKKQLEKYKKDGALQNYMKLLLKGVESGKYKIPKYELLAINMVKKTSQ